MEALVPTQADATLPTGTQPKNDQPRPYKCGICEKTFVRREHLKRHEQYHTKEKPFECSTCTRCFTRRDVLLRHQMKLHGRQPAPPAAELPPRLHRSNSFHCRDNTGFAGSSPGRESVSGGLTAMRFDGEADRANLSQALWHSPRLENLHSASALDGRSWSGLENTELLFPGFDMTDMPPGLLYNSSDEARLSKHYPLSTGSTANRALRDGNLFNFDTDYQSPSFSRRKSYGSAGSAAGSAHSNYEIPKMSPSLLPMPPVNIISAEEREDPIQCSLYDPPQLLEKAQEMSMEHEVGVVQDTHLAAQPAPWAQAYQLCSQCRLCQAKCTFEAGLTDDRCQRCFRLNLQCSLAGNTLQAAGVSQSNELNTSLVADDCPKVNRICYLCKKTVFINRKRDWQRHVLKDLKPYQCFEIQCRLSIFTYSRRSNLDSHYETWHPRAAVMVQEHFDCPFCAERLTDKPSARFRHIGRHMEDISFSTVPRQYDEWEFYTDQSGARSALETNPSAFTPNQ